VSAGEAGLRFWLRYVESVDGLVEDMGDSTLVVLPPRQQAELELPEELMVTSDPDVAREDGATFVAAGHPVLAKAAATVLAEGDVGVLSVPAPASIPPDSQTLLAKAREQVPVDHGRIDLAGSVTRGIRPVLRVGALANYTVSAEDHFQERLECWVDVTTRLPLPDKVISRLVQLEPVVAGGSTAIPRLGAAVAEAHRLIEADAVRRQAVLSSQARDACEAERDRARVYYEEALASIERRLAFAPDDRRELLAARADSTRAEQARRLAEIEEKYQATHEIKPYRLHLVQVPILRCPVEVLRGSRRYPLVLEWLLPVSCFAGLRCPSCGEPAPLVAKKTMLGCQRCLVGP
jgi:hypothetical protein